MRYFLVALLAAFSLSAQGQKLARVKPAPNISVKLPKAFEPMTPEDREQRYQSARLPIALYTDVDRMAEFGINRAYSVWSEKDLELLEEFYQASILELYDKVNFLSKGIREVNKKRFVYFEFESVVYPENKFQRAISKYTYLMYAVSGGTTYVFNFTSEKSMQAKWQPVAREVMASIKLR